MKRAEWILRPTVWFATASMATTVLHEFTHAAVAYALGVRSTLFNYLVDLDLTPAQAATDARAIIGIAGPLFCLVLGIAAWFAFKSTRGLAAELPLLFVAVFGVGTFFGNLMSASFVGDFSFAAVAMGLPMPVRYAASVLGVCCTAAIHFWAGRELARWVPPAVGKVEGMLGIIVVPVILGTAGMVLANLPSVSVPVRSIEAAFWVFAAIGAANHLRARLRWSAVALAEAEATPYVRDAGRPDGPYVGRGFSRANWLRWGDTVALLVAIVIVRLLVRGIPFVP